MVSQVYVQDLKKKLHYLNPLASIVLGNKQASPLINLDAQQSPLDKLFQHTNHAAHSEVEQQFPVSKPHAHHHHKHTEEMVSHTFHFDQPFDYQMLDRQLFLYLMLQSAGLYRMKGLVWFDGSEDQYVVQSVGKRLNIEKKGIWQTGEKKKSVVVFIGKNLKRQGIEKLLNKCVNQPQT